MAHRVTLIPGDGIGPELTEATRRVLEATGVEFEWDVQPAGADVMDDHGGNPLPEETLESIRRNRVALKGPITTPVGDGFRSVNVGLRVALDMYAQVRPCKTYPGVRTRYEDIDLVIVRETTEDIYAGIEFEQGSPDAEELRAWLEAHGEKLPMPDSGISIKPISITGTRRVFEFAFDYARKMGRQKITAVHKANIMKFTDGLWLRVARAVAAENPDIAFDDKIADNMCMQLVQWPEDYDMMVLPNLYGDIISDLAAGLIGGLGVAPGANFGKDVAVFEPTHGSAPKYAGQNKVNPIAQMLSGMLMLRHLDEMDAADRLETAIADLIREGKSLTYDMKPSRDDPTAVGTSQVADALIEKLQSSRSPYEPCQGNCRRRRERRRDVRPGARDARLRRRRARRHQGRTAAREGDRYRPDGRGARVRAFDHRHERVRGDRRVGGRRDHRRRPARPGDEPRRPRRDEREDRVGGDRAMSSRSRPTPCSSSSRTRSTRCAMSRRTSRAGHVSGCSGWQGSSTRRASRPSSPGRRDRP